MTTDQDQVVFSRTSPGIASPHIITHSCHFYAISSLTLSVSFSYSPTLYRIITVDVCTTTFSPFALKKSHHSPQTSALFMISLFIWFYFLRTTPRSHPHCSSPLSPYHSSTLFPDFITSCSSTGAFLLSSSSSSASRSFHRSFVLNAWYL